MEVFVKCSPIGGAFTLVACIAGVVFAENDELDREIARLKKEITRVEAQRGEEARQVKKERAEFQAYKDRTRSRITTITNQTDSIKSAMELIVHRNDSLHAALSAVNAQIREQELLGQKIAAVIGRAVKKLQLELDRLPPLVREQYRGPLGFLLTELEAGTVENTEALHRMVRIVQDLRTVSQEIQVVEGGSPVPQIRGSVYRIRIGSVFEAIVDNRGEKAFLWTGKVVAADSMWIPVENEGMAAAILKAVNIREGKTVPELVELPLAGRPRSAEEGGNEQ